nr:SDR family oxidoreductase [Nocardia acidivorans]
MRRAVPGALPYSTAKAAIEGLTRALAVEYGRHGIRVNALAPGSVVTERFTEYLAALTPEAATLVEREIAALHPMGRAAMSDEIASVVEFLLSAQSGFVNGATLPVDCAARPWASIRKRAEATTVIRRLVGGEYTGSEGFDSDRVVHPIGFDQHRESPLAGDQPWELLHR